MSGERFNPSDGLPKKSLRDSSRLPMRAALFGSLGIGVALAACGGGNIEQQAAPGGEKIEPTGITEISTPESTEEVNIGGRVTPILAEAPTNLIEPEIAEIGQLAPNVTLTSASGEVKTISEIRAGKPLIITYLSSYRGDPKFDLASEILLKRKFGDQIEIIAVYSLGNEDILNIPVRDSEIYSTNEEFDRRYQTTIPKYFFIDKFGVLAFRDFSGTAVYNDSYAKALISKGYVLQGAKGEMQLPFDFDSTAKIEDIMDKLKAYYEENAASWLEKGIFDQSLARMRNPKDVFEFSTLLQNASAYTNIYCRTDDPTLEGLIREYASASYMIYKDLLNRLKPQYRENYSWGNFRWSFDTSCSVPIITNEITTEDKASVQIRSLETRDSYANSQYEDLNGNIHTLAESMGKVQLVFMIPNDKFELDKVELVLTDELMEAIRQNNAEIKIIYLASIGEVVSPLRLAIEDPSINYYISHWRASENQLANEFDFDLDEFAFLFLDKNAQEATEWTFWRYDISNDDMLLMPSMVGLLANE